MTWMKKVHGLNDKHLGLDEKLHGSVEYSMHWMENSMFEIKNTMV